MRKEIFRNSAIQKMSSLDQLDKTISILKPSGWVALIAVIIVIGAALFWGFFGSVADRVSGHGVVVSNEEMTRINYVNQGMVKEILIRNEDYVEKDQLIAVIERNDLIEEMNLTQKKNREHAEPVHPHGEHEQDFRCQCAEKEADAGAPLPGPHHRE